MNETPTEPKATTKIETFSILHLIWENSEEAEVVAMEASFYFWKIGTLKVYYLQLSLIDLHAFQLHVITILEIEQSMTVFYGREEHMQLLGAKCANQNDVDLE